MHILFQKLDIVVILFHAGIHDFSCTLAPNKNMINYKDALDASVTPHIPDRMKLYIRKRKMIDRSTVVL